MISWNLKAPKTKKLSQLADKFLPSTCRKVDPKMKTGVREENQPH